MISSFLKPQYTRFNPKKLNFFFSLTRQNWDKSKNEEEGDGGYWWVNQNLCLFFLFCEPFYSTLHFGSPSLYCGLLYKQLSKSPRQKKTQQELLMIKIEYLKPKFVRTDSRGKKRHYIWTKVDWLTKIKRAKIKTKSTEKMGEKIKWTK